MSNDSVVPADSREGRKVYARIQQALQEMIEGPAFSPGDRIPSERELAEQFSISRMTMRKAITNLVRTGVLERRSTSGTFVASPRVQRPLDRSLQSLSKTIEQGGGAAGSKLLFFEMSRANERVGKCLKIEEDADVVVIRRLRSANGLPFCVETTYLPAGRVPGLIADDLAGNASLYDLLKSRYGIEAAYDEGTISVAPVTLLESELLNLPAASSALLYRAIIYDSSGLPVEYLVSVNHPQRVVFKASTSVEQVNSVTP
ncbi:GntR family transcriptional regulator [bacterium M00.F.Ca.ET.228.01.1.1]|uniref:GntR family transcriptional regulator n=1 Tax=Paraburkholderia phenoliruptrix TaxID=252970 RepID=UPI001091D2BD|nr:GntR family transcriptional regulator [Paraburkholderia phenoliruptrix]TGP42154.1 GntR family transcriptional regulator [bacterium M00.F.Ca.ET.228.01.1.1]TGR99585.1 GntR family transcriptional regulator [bacterium M00.F.Ca.ET.191.01.1.1]TGU03952.1 GntR family transcriptional regulator [bacterium M00.F.Ca.ET.155.01.1.1]MBW0448288.1 GntR family transcriptional regulator [Paraburkholderia phenoliruptrix]MBW9099499.1 GntR family transcriptional regulator [Paraburkholderia phenoliruptrix]